MSVSVVAWTAAVVVVLSNAALVALAAALASVGAEAPRGSDSASAEASRTGDALRLGSTACSIGLGALVVLLTGASVAAWVGAAPGPRPGATMLVLAADVTAAAVVVRLVAPALGATRPRRTISVLGGPGRGIAAVLAPAAARSAGVAAAVARALPTPSSPGDVRGGAGRDELRRMVRDSERIGSISHADAEMLERSLRFAGKTASDALTPRVEVRSLPVAATVGDLIEASIGTGLSRFPVHDRDLDDIVGVVHVKDVLGLGPGGRRDRPITDLLRPVMAVPESKDLGELMVDLRHETGQFALVVDEYGGTKGIITLEDLIEEVVGEIDDEHDISAGMPAVTRWAGAHLVPGRLHRDDLEERSGFLLPEGGFDTLGGLVMDRLGRVPEVGDAFSEQGWTVEVVEMEGHRVATVRLVAPAPGVIDERGAV